MKLIVFKPIIKQLRPFHSMQVSSLFIIVFKYFGLGVLPAVPCQKRGESFKPPLFLWDSGRAVGFKAPLAEACYGSAGVACHFPGLSFKHLLSTRPASAVHEACT